uniref:Uncharacterized protein n=1 Tax=viral metagenome TaxID=1070528 RepID=A0A6M3KSD7_9ZZZZ
METSRKVRKALNKESTYKEPIILFLPGGKIDSFVIYTKEQKDVITITDKPIYDRVLHAVMAALKQNREGVVQGETQHHE